MIEEAGILRVKSDIKGRVRKTANQKKKIFVIPEKSFLAKEIKITLKKKISA